MLSEHLVQVKINKLLKLHIGKSNRIEKEKQKRDLEVIHWSKIIKGKLVNEEVVTVKDFEVGKLAFYYENEVVVVVKIA